MFKKIALVAVLLASAAFAQFNIGEHASFTFGTVWGEDTDNSNWGAGYTAGFDFKAPIDNKLSFVAALEVDYRRIADDEEEYGQKVDYTIFFWYLRLPAMARFYVDPKFFGELGLSAAIRLSSGVRMDGESEGYDVFSGRYYSSDEMNRVEIGLIAGIGFAVTPKVDFNIRYSMGVLDMVSKGEGGSKNMRFQTGLTYWFN